ncbi:MAG: hypothetical protein POELPBGB_03218 [Bacteroidia bacterium]|nr:hypothetical protein [Bacteroidia bacterium]
MKQLTKRELERQDLVDNSIFELLQTINPSEKEIEWDIEMIGEVRDVVSKLFVEELKLSSEKKFYPYING